jgi:hypothetical protein
MITRFKDFTGSEGTGVIEDTLPLACGRPQVFLPPQVVAASCGGRGWREAKDDRPHARQPGLDDHL